MGKLSLTNIWASCQRRIYMWLTYLLQKNTKENEKKANCSKWDVQWDKHGLFSKRCDSIIVGKNITWYITFLWEVHTCWMPAAQNRFNIWRYFLAILTVLFLLLKFVFTFQLVLLVYTILNISYTYVIPVLCLCVYIFVCKLFFLLLPATMQTDSVRGWMCYKLKWVYCTVHIYCKIVVKDYLRAWGLCIQQARN